MLCTSRSITFIVSLFLSHIVQYYNNIVQQINAKMPQNSSLNYTSIKFGTDIFKRPLFHKRALATQKFKMVAFFSKMAAIHWSIASF